MTFTIREPGSALTHMLAALLTMIGATPLLIRAVMTGSAITFAAMVVFITSMLLLYTASTLYHSLNIGGKVLTYFRKIDHMMIFVLIAGSYTPVCLLVLEPVSGRLLLCAVWGLARAGISWYGAVCMECCWHVISSSARRCWVAVAITGLVA